MNRFTEGFLRRGNGNIAQAMGTGWQMVMKYGSPLPKKEEQRDLYTKWVTNMTTEIEPIRINRIERDVWI